jgi:hypothetical protein
MDRANIWSYIVLKYFTCVIVETFLSKLAAHMEMGVSFGHSLLQIVGMQAVTVAIRAQTVTLRTLS